MDQATEPALAIVSLPLGMTMTNTYLVADRATKSAVVVDPGDEGERIVAEASARGWEITAIWLTHAHFDHIGGIAGMAAALNGSLPLALHPADTPLWDVRGGAALFGQPDIDPGMQPSIDLEDGARLLVGKSSFHVRHTPGHTRGHVIFVADQAPVAFVGDLVFQGSVGRTDLPGGDWQTLLESIRDQVLTLPEEFQLFPGHGPATSVARERRSNPFLEEIT